MTKMATKVVLRAYDYDWGCLEARVFETSDGRYRIKYHDKMNQRSGFAIGYADTIWQAKILIEERQGSVDFRD